jgi:hypothetical protein
MRRSNLAWGAVFLAALEAGSASALSPGEVFEKVAPSVWAVRSLDEQERPFGYGSAVVIGPGQLVTNCHVLAKAKHIQLRRENVTYEAKLELAHHARDLCLLSAKNFPAPAVMIGKLEDVKVGQRVYAVGNPQRLALTLSEGLISGLRGEEGKPLLQTTAPISPGSSGGGLFDENGLLIGITTFGIVNERRTTQNLNFAVPAEWARELTAPKAAAAPRDDLKQAAAVAGLPPVGATWKYRFHDRQYARNDRVFTVRVSGIESRDVRESFAVENGGESSNAVDTGSMRFATRRLNRDYAVIELAPYYFFTDQGRASTPQPPSNYPGDAPWRIEAVELSTEVVTVPAGTYNAMRIDVRGTAGVHGVAGMSAAASAGHLPARFNYTAWYATEVNRYVMIQHRTWNLSQQQISDEVVQLLEYRLN